jgi:hypothetical protein
MGHRSAGIAYGVSADAPHGTAGLERKTSAFVLIKQDHANYRHSTLWRSKTGSEEAF